jgi:hypothetical protein
MKKLMCLIAAMLVAGAVVADDYIVVKTANNSEVNLSVDADLTLLDRSITPARGLHYIPDSENSSKKVDARNSCEIKFHKPTVPVGFDLGNLGNYKMQVKILYGESSLHKFQYSEKFDVQVDRDRLTFASDVVDFTIEADPWVEYR